MKGELETHLDTTKPLSGHRRNGKMTDDSFYKLVYLAYRNIRKLKINLGQLTVTQ